MHQRHKLTLVLFSYLFLLAALVAAGYHFYADQEQRFEEEAHNQLRVIADLKVAQLADWRKERIADGEVVGASSAVVPAIKRLLEGSGALDGMKAVTEWMKVVKDSHGYSNISVVDARGTVRFSLGSMKELNNNDLALSTEALNSRKVALSDLHRTGEADPVHMSVAVPVPALRDEDPRGVILLWIDPIRQFYPLLQSWPTASRSGETLLVRREGDHVIFLNELRHRKNTALRFKLPLNSQNHGLPAAAAASGHEGYLTGLDYRGVAVVAVSKRVPGSPWYVIAKVDESELYTPAHQRSTLVSIVLLLFALGIGPAIWWLWQRQQSRLNLVRRQSEVTRRAVVGHYSYLSRHANDIIMLEEEDGRIMEANERAEQAYGYSHDELLRMNIRDLLHPESLLEFETRWKATLNPGGVIYEIRHRRQDGSVLPVEVSARVIDVDGEIFRQTIARDITERKLNEVRVRRAAAYNRRLIEASLDPLVTIDPQGRISDVNTATEDVTGYPREELLGTDFSDYFTDPEKARDAYQKAFREGQIQDYELEIRHRKGGVTQVTYNAAVYRDKEGEVIGVFAAARDITERKRIQSEIEKLNQELEQRIQRRTCELEEANRELEAFTYSVSHDLRTPLRAVHGFSRILGEQFADQLSPAAQRCLDMVRQNALRMGALIDDLLALSRLGRQPLNVRPVAPDVLVRQALDELSDQLVGRQSAIIVGNLPKCTADPTLLKYVFLNLLSNAIKYTRRREMAHIEVGCSRLADFDRSVGENDLRQYPPNSYVYYVRDNGAGFDMRYVGKLFGVFQRLHSETEFEGTGVGLAIVERIIRRHGGRVWAEGKVEGGATFYFTVGGGVSLGGDPSLQTVSEVDAVGQLDDKGHCMMLGNFEGPRV